MKYLRLVPLFSFLALCAAHAQRGGEPEPIPDFTNLDEYIYEPKTTLSIGFRTVGGAKTSFSGTGVIKSSIDDIGNATDANIARHYHDGDVLPDTRGTLVDNGDGTASFVPITPDGKTNTWQFGDDKQSTFAPGYIAMHSYSATITDPTARSQNSSGSAGLDLGVTREMGKLFNTRMLWSLTAGVTINDLSAKSNGHVLANLTTVTDLYSLYGEVAPAAPYSAPSTPVTVPVTDASGNPVLNPDGSAQTVTVDNTVLLGNSPTNRSTSTVTDSTSVSTASKLKGAYYTFRVGPTLSLPITQRFQASVSFGAILVYAGTAYTVTQSYQPEIGPEIDDTLLGETTKLLPGYFVDATLQFNVTARSGIYAGAMFQEAGDYTQNVSGPTGSYSTKVEFGHQSGFRAGMTIKF